MSVGGLTRDEVEGMRTGRIAVPRVGQVAALAAVFGAPTSYLVDLGRGRMVSDKETLEPLTEETAAAILRESVHLPERKKGIVLGIVREFGETT
jgi:hypothetical protein